MKFTIKDGTLALLATFCVVSVFFILSCGGGGGGDSTSPTPEQPAMPEEPATPEQPEPIANIDPNVPLFMFGDGVSEEEKENFRNTAYRIMHFLNDEYGVTLNKNVTFYVYVDRENFLDAYAEYHNAPESQIETWREILQERQNIFGEEFWGTFDDKAIFIHGRHFVNNNRRLLRVTAHEYFHAVQTIGHIGSDGVRHIGAEWLVEGSARYVEALTFEFFGEPLENYSKQAEINFVRDFSESLESLESFENFFSPERDSNLAYSLSRLASEFLAENYGGLEAIFQYYRAFDPNVRPEEGFDVRWEEVFEDTFGISVEDFYQEFKEYRSNGFSN